MNNTHNFGLLDLWIVRFRLGHNLHESCLRFVRSVRQSFDGRKAQCPFCKDDLEYEEGRQRRKSQRQEAVVFDEQISSPTSNPPQTTPKTPKNMDIGAELHEQIKLAEEKGEILTETARGGRPTGASSSHKLSK